MGEDDRQCFGGRSGRVAVYVVHLLAIEWSKKGQIETLREHQQDASYHGIIASSICEGGKYCKQAKIAYILKCSKGLVLSR
jgi:hypothetical protein